MYEPLSSRNPFEVDNAKNLNRDELVNTFIPTPKFWRLLEPKHHVVLGSRGSGKTALARMLSHDHLSRLSSKKAQELVDSKSIIGVYIPTNVEWVSALNNKPWQEDDGSAEKYFQWRLNLSICVAFLITAESCLSRYSNNQVQRARKENAFVKTIAEDWLDSPHDLCTINEVREQLHQIAYNAEVEITRNRVLGQACSPEPTSGINFSTPLFHPVRKAMTSLAPLLDIPDTCKWIIIIDETEFLDSKYQRILNTFLRTQSENPSLVFKITTMPYCHYTLNTNLEVPLNLGHDFEYIYIDQDPVQQKSGDVFASHLFTKRAKEYGLKLDKITLEGLFGESPLLDAKNSAWEPGSNEYELLRKYASKETFKRAESLIRYPRKFKDQISRKIHGALLLRDSAGKQSGKRSSGVYSGWKMLIRCSDGNPRRLIRIFNRFWLQRQNNRNISMQPFSPEDQDRTLKSFSKSILYRTKSEPTIGNELFELLNMVGSFMKDRLYSQPLSTDQITSIRIDKNVSKEDWQCIKRAVGLGLLFPNINPNNPDHIPDRDGTFHLAYVLSPYFSLPPRREKARTLASIRNALLIKHNKEAHIEQPDLFLEEN